MTPGKMRAATIMQKSGQVNAMLRGIERLPLASLEVFIADPRNPAAAESFLRRALEGILDLARHILAKGLALAPAEYKEVAALSAASGVVTQELGGLMTRIAGYRNRMVHFYDEVSDEELYDICANHLADLRLLLDALLDWIRRRPDLVDTSF